MISQRPVNTITDCERQTVQMYCFSVAGQIESFRDAESLIIEEKNNISVHILHMLWLNTNQKAPVFVCMLNVIYVNITYKIYLYTFMYISKQ